MCIWYTWEQLKKLDDLHWQNDNIDALAAFILSEQVSHCASLVFEISVELELPS